MPCAPHVLRVSTLCGLGLACAQTSRVVEDDGGKSFSAVGDAISGFIPATVDVAATDANVIYASGLAGTMGALLRSSDGGKTFMRFALPSTMSGRRPFIAAVDPRNADTVYVRFDVQGSSPLAVTHDGGKSFVTPLTTTVSLAGFALSPDGKTVIASNAYDGTFRADADTLVFEKVACSGPTCLSFSDAGLFGCGDQSLDGFIVGRSDDLGASFQRSVDLTCVRGPVACDSATSVGSLCPAAWPYVQSQLGATECSPPSVQPNTSCLGDAGTGAVGTTGGTAAGDKSGSAGGASGDKADSGGQSSSGTASSGSCGCRAASAAPRQTAWWLGVVAVWVTRRRRRLCARNAA